jgi:hypothetical protein
LMVFRCHSIVSESRGMGEELSLQIFSTNPFLCTVGKPNRKVMNFSAFSYSGSPPPSLKPVKIFKSFSSVRMDDTSSSRPTSPRSTHCSAEMEVMSLVQDARMNVAPTSIGSVGVLGPNAPWYLNFPSR